MGKASRNRRRAAAVKARRTKSGSPFWYAATGVIIIVGVIAIAMSRGSNAAVAPFANTDHWHAALGVNVCGTWLPNTPAFENRAGTSVRAGLHSHADGLMHIHPYSSDEAGKRATVGLFLKYGGWKVTSDQLQVWDTNKPHKNGEKCDGKPAKVRWSVNGKERTGNPGAYRAQQGDVVALAFLPAGQKIGTPPQAKDLATPSDTGASATTTPTPSSESTGGSTVPGATSATTTPGSTTAPTGATTTPPTSAP
ncbi:MAG: hypothetical protein QOI55_1857 [Actinomycetota bacterium]|nr:hypothetical protein [Actinomycetota bacterium]